jgi:hypothetical protein
MFTASQHTKSTCPVTKIHPLTNSGMCKLRARKIQICDLLSEELISHIAYLLPIPKTEFSEKYLGPRKAK